jgi:hypothetical protein
MFDNKIVFYVVLVILIRQCHSVTEAINYSTNLQKVEQYRSNINEIGSSSSGSSSSSSNSISNNISAKMHDVRNLLRSLIFDWNFGESEIEGKYELLNIFFVAIINKIIESHFVL